MLTNQKYELIVMGASSGGMKAVMNILSGLKDSFTIPIVIVLHQLRSSEGKLVGILQSKTNLCVKEPLDKEKIEPSTIYVAPPDYHLMIEENKTFGYSYSETVNYSRPSIDVLFDTAAQAYKKLLVCVLLTGANDDGAKGSMQIKMNGGLTIVEDPESADMAVMPKAAIQLFKPDKTLHLNQISNILNQLDYGIESVK